MLVDGDAKDVMVTSCFTGVNASFLRPSLVGNGLDPANLAPATQGGAININNGGANGKAWRDIWSAEIGRAHVCNLVTNAPLVCCLLLENKTHIPDHHHVNSSTIVLLHTP